jgi:FkbM family methyltransferase
MPEGPERTGGKGFNPRVARLLWLRARASDPALRLVERLVGEGQTVVDIGADVGLYSSRLAELVGPSGRVHAFEPNPARHEVLAALAAAQPQVELHLPGLSDHAGEEDLHVPIRGGAVVSAFGRLSPPPAGAEGVSWERTPVEVTPLDRELSGERSRISFVKCDVEGHELAVMRGAEQTLRAAMPTLLVEIEQRHSEAGVEATFEYLLGLGYSGWAIGPGGPYPLDRFDLERDQLAFVSGFDLSEVPSGYVNDFLFAPPSLDLERELSGD